MEVIDASTVEGKAQVEYWPEEDNENPITGLYWRQTFDAQKMRLSVSMAFSIPEHVSLTREKNSACEFIVSAANTIIPISL